MNDMTPIAASSPIERYSAGEISRHELGNLLGEPISFGDTLMLLHELHLQLPQYSKSFNPDGIALIRKWAELNKDG